ncbi:MAG: hypothetical protein ABEI52_10210, partial [Halobacteriaceae archaeon]
MDGWKFVIAGFVLVLGIALLVILVYAGNSAAPTGEVSSVVERVTEVTVRSDHHGCGTPDMTRLVRERVVRRGGAVCADRFGPSWRYDGFVRDSC